MGPWRSPVAHLHGMQGVRGSNPLGSTTSPRDHSDHGGFFAPVEFLRYLPPLNSTEEIAFFPNGIYARILGRFIDYFPASSCRIDVISPN